MPLASARRSGFLAAIVPTLSCAIWFLLGYVGFVRVPGWLIPETILAETRGDEIPVPKHVGYKVEKPRWSTASYSVTVFVEGDIQRPVSIRFEVPETLFRVQRRQWMENDQKIFLEFDSEHTSSDGIHRNRFGIYFDFVTAELRSCASSEPWYVSVFHITRTSRKALTCDELEAAVLSQTDNNPVVNTPQH